MLNKVTLIGNVGADPEIRTLESGVKVARVNIATTERILNRQTQEVKEHTEWHRVTLWRGLADVADKFVKKGSQLYIEGRIRSNEWTDDQGNKRYSVEIVADEMKLLGRKSDNIASSSTEQPMPKEAPSAASQPQTTSQTTASPVVAEDPDDLPF